MNTHDAWEGVDVLIPKRVHQNRREAIQAACLDLGALIGALPGTSPTPLDAALSDVLAHADADDCKAWIMRAIRALPTQADMEATNGDA
jgi:hypothetical protein